MTIVFIQTYRQKCMLLWTIHCITKIYLFNALGNCTILIVTLPTAWHMATHNCCTDKSVKAWKLTHISRTNLLLVTWSLVFGYSTKDSGRKIPGFFLGTGFRSCLFFHSSWEGLGSCFSDLPDFLVPSYPISYPEQPVYRALRNTSM